MTGNWRPMWEGLGIDLEAHDVLLGVLGKAYKDVYMTQEGRPEAMKYFDFVVSEVHGMRVKELLDARAEGRKVVGSFCVYVPEELILAVGGVSVGLCAGAAWAPEEAEKHVPRTTCALIKGFFGFQLGKVCPYLMASDVIVGENTCDGKKKAYEIFDGIVGGRMHVIDLPHVKSAAGRSLLRAEYARFASVLEERSGRRIAPAALRKGIETVNAKRRALARLAKLRAADPAPISGLDALLVSQISFYDDPPRFTKAVNDLCDELDRRISRKEGAKPAGAPRILMSGCPMAVPNWKVPAIVERGTAAVIVGEESCVGERGLSGLVEESGKTVDAMLDALVDRYMGIGCAVFTPNPGRMEKAMAMVRDLHAQGVIHYALQFCHPYTMEAGPAEERLEAAGIPALRIETDYGSEDSEQIRTRVEAFVERIGARR